MATHIPDVFMTKIANFLKSGATGQVLLHVHLGAIKACDITECLRVNQGQGVVERREHLSTMPQR